MISGTLLLGTNKDEKLTIFFKKRFSKIVIPFLFWSIFYYFYSNRHQLSKVSLISVIKALIQGNIMYHLWFMYLIIGIYFVVPILRIYIKGASKKDLKYLIILWFLSCPTIQMLNYFLKLNIAITIPIVNNSIGIFILGYYLDIIEITKLQRILIYIIGLAFIPITMIGTYLISNKNSVDEFFYGYSNLNNVVIAIAIFIFLKNFNKKYPIDNMQFKKNIVSISNLTFGIYLIHPFILDIFTRGIMGIKLNNNFIETIYGLPLTAILIFLCSCIVLLILKKIKFIKKIVG
jgi:surface polysaccharide O-acyltransferase-like enzyme